MFTDLRTDINSNLSFILGGFVEGTEFWHERELDQK